MGMGPSAALRGWVDSRWVDLPQGKGRPSGQGSRVCRFRTGDLDAESGGTPFLRHLRSKFRASVSLCVSSVLAPRSSKLGHQVG